MSIQWKNKAYCTVCESEVSLDIDGNLKCGHVGAEMDEYELTMEDNYEELDFDRDLITTYEDEENDEDEETYEDFPEEIFIDLS